MQMLLTPAGTRKIAASMVGGSLFAPATIVLGDGGAGAGLPYTVYEPTGAETQLRRQVAQFVAAAVSRPPADPGDVVIEVVVPVTAGDWWVTEIGVLDADGELIAIGKVPPFQKVGSASGSYDDLVLEVALSVGRAANVVVTIDASKVIATRDYVRTELSGLKASLLFHGLM